MFIVGEPKDIAQTYLEGAFTKGPGALDKSVDEMDEEDLRIMMTYYYMALRHAYRERQTAEVLEILLECYDEIFVALVKVSETFVKKMLEGRIQTPMGPEYKTKYYRLASGAR